MPAHTRVEKIGKLPEGNVTATLTLQVLGVKSTPIVTVTVNCGGTPYNEALEAVHAVLEGIYLRNVERANV